MKKDIILKELTKEAVKEILKYIIGINVEKIEFLNIEFPNIQIKKADILVKASQKIIHIEFQSKNDSSMLFRELRYFCEIQNLYPQYEIFQYVLYIGKEKLNMQHKLNKHNINYFYDIIDIKKLDCEEFFRIDTPEALVLAVLCDFKDKNEREIIKKILSRLLKITKNENEFRKYLLMLEELSTSRDLKNIIKEEEMGLMDIRWEDLPSYEIGLEKGIKDGMEQGLQQGLQKGKIESAKIMIRDFRLSIDEVSKKLDIPLDLLKKELNG